MNSFLIRPGSPILRIAVVLLAAQACLSGQQPALPSTAAARFATADIHVPMPKDIQCAFKSIRTEGIVGSGEMVKLNGSVSGFFCWIVAKGSESAKEVPLASTEITDGVLPTKSFGMFHVAEVGSADNRAGSFHEQISILRDKLPSFRAFLKAPVATSTRAAANQPSSAPEILEGTLIFGFTAKPSMGAGSGDMTMVPSGLSIDANGQKYGILLNKNTKVPQGWNLGGVSAIDPGRYSVRGKIFDDQIQADEIKYLGK